MFYYPYVLQRHSGCFSTIWLAATKGIRLNRREFLKVNVGRTCEDIMDYVLVQAPPRNPGLPRPRFSLYLSSQLQYGVIIVYHRQCVILLEEIQQTIERLIRSERHACIDVAEPDRRAYTLPDSLVLLEEAERAQDPFFGVMGAEQGLPSPYRLLQPWQSMEALSPQRPPTRNNTTTPEEGLTAPSGSITLKEKELALIPAAEFEGAELPEVTVKEIDMLMEQQDQFYEELEDKERERAAEGERVTLSGTTLSVEQLKEHIVEETIWLLDEETGQPVEVPVFGAQMEKTPPTIAMPVAPPSRPGGEESEREGGSSSELLHGEVPAKRPVRRRQLLFIDPDMQIPQDAMQAQIQNTLVETTSLSQVLLERPSQQRVSPAELFSKPCSTVIHPDLLSQWNRAAVSSLPSSAERRKAVEGDSKSEAEREMEVVRKEVEGGRKHKDSSIREISAELIESALASEASAVSEAFLEVSKDDLPQDQATPVGRWSPIEGAPVPMEGIPEEQVKLPPGDLGETVGTTESLLELVSQYLMHYGKVYFDSLLPPETDRSTAAHLLSALLELVCVRKLSVSQAKPYGSIAISSGQLFAVA
ncbi:REC8 meiotic recombination protein b [Anguilla anguilla]|uniref:REC8 meiotic recombination protein b n=1 Tax=Anguilla anguilla TaxID=7936 RepID=UPI0015A75D54|nr:REC8 meiotic recombination protein b [Anguilla anguilla]